MSASSSTKPVEERLAARLWEHGKIYRYRLSMTNRTVLGGGLPLVDFALVGNLVLVAESETDDGIRVVLRLVNAKFNPTTTASNSQYEALAKELAKPYLAVFRDGILREERVSIGLTKFAESMIRNIGASLQLGLTAPSQAEHWPVTEHDATGDYVADYHAISRGVIAKAKRKYSARGVATSGMMENQTASITPEVVSSEGRYDVSGGSLSLIQNKEQLSLTLSDTSKLTSATELAIQLENSGSEPEPRLNWEQLADLTEPRRSKDLGVEGPARAHFDELRIGNLRFDEVLLGIEKNAAQGAGKLVQSVNSDTLSEESISKNRNRLDADARLFRAAEALLRRDLANIAVAVKKIKTHSKISDVLMDALGAADTPETQAALVSLMQSSKLSDEERQRAAYSLIRVDTATEATVAALTSELHRDPVHLHAILGLGSIARKLQNGGQDARANAIVSQLLSDLNAASTEERLSEVLHAIANSANVKALDAVEKFLTHDSQIVRGAAIDAMRLMKSERVDVALAKQLTWDDIDSVRVATVSAIGVRTPTPNTMQAITQAARFDKYSSVRLRATEVLGMWLARHPDVRVTLEFVARSDANESVKQAAKKYIGDPPS